MKTEFTDVSPTRKTLSIEIPSDVVDAEINRIAKGYTKQARLPGFRPGKVPASVIKQRFREEILHDIRHTLIPKVVDEQLQARGIAPVEAPNIRDVALREGHPLTFTAAVDTVPPFDPGDLATITLRQMPGGAIDEDDVDKALDQLRDRAAKFEPVDGRPVGDGDTVVVDMTRQSGDEAPDRQEVGSPGTELEFAL